MKHIPLRVCVSCKQQFSKKELLRIVYSPDGSVLLDKNGKTPGRGAYVCKTRKCIDAALSKGRLSRALKVVVPDDVRKQVAEEG